MSDRPSPQAEVAYRRAVSAYQRGSFDEAQRCATDALAIDPAHVAAAALLRRIGGRDAGPRVAPMDPTLLTSGNGGSGMAEPADPTVVVPRRIPRPVPPKRNAAPPSPPQRPAGRRSSEPTVIVPSNGGSRGLGNASSDRPTSSLWQRLWGGGRREGFPVGGATPWARGILIVAGAIAFAAASVAGVIAAYRWAFSEGPRLTIEVAEGGKIIGDSIRCGSGGSRCSASFSKGDRVELTPEADRDYEFVKFTGDCEATRGILLMDGPKTCGARFERIGPPQGPAKYTLTIEKPKGGTILYGDVITCGTLGADCSEDIPAEEVVTLRRQADDGYIFDGFFAECKGGEFVMNSAKTCGAVFLADQSVNRPPRAKVERAESESGPRRKSDQPPASKETTTPERSGPPPAPPAPEKPPNQAAPTPPGSLPPVIGTSEQQKPAQPPDDMETHAKKEIKQRLDEYCSALETLKPEEVLKVFPRQDARTLKRQFEGYKSLKCAWTSEPKYNRFDIGAENGAASAQVQIGMKQTLQMRSGGAPKAPPETSVTIDLSRFDLRSRWKIDDMRAVEKK